MASRKLTNQNKVAILTDWFNSPTNRQDILYFNQSEMNGNDLVKQAFGAGLFISFTPVDNNVGKLVFVDILT